MKHTYYGNLRGRFEGKGFELLFRGIGMWLLVMVPILAAIIYPIAAIDWGSIKTIGSASMEEFLRNFAAANPTLPRAAATAIAIANLAILFAVLLFPVFQAMVMRWWLDGLRIGEVAISSQLRVGTIYYSYARFRAGPCYSD